MGTRETHPRPILDVPPSGPVMTVRENGDEVGSWVTCRQRVNGLVSPPVWITAAQADARSKDGHSRALPRP